MKTAAQYQAEAKRQELKDKAELNRVSGKLPVPEGFKTTWRVNEFNHDRNASPDEFVIYKEDDIEFVFRAGGSGTTKFRVKDGWRTFDRRGVEDSFYWKPWNKHSKIDFDDLLKRQFERIEQSRKYHETAIKVPDIGFTIAPESLKALKSQLLNKGYITFTPSGFGTGYNIVRRSNRRFGVRRGSTELEKFFGVSPLFIESMDCD